MAQQGQVFKLKKTAADGDALWAYRYRVGGRDARRVQRGGFLSEEDAAEALARALERLRRSNGTAAALTLAELVDEYLAQHDAQPETIEKLRWLLTKATRVWRVPARRAELAGDRCLANDDPGALGGTRSGTLTAWSSTAIRSLRSRSESLFGSGGTNEVCHQMAASSSSGNAQLRSARPPRRRRQSCRCCRPGATGSVGRVAKAACSGLASRPTPRGAAVGIYGTHEYRKCARVGHIRYASVP